MAREPKLADSRPVASSFRLDMEKFFALTAAIAAAGCSPAQGGSNAKSAQQQPDYDTTQGSGAVTVPEPEAIEPEATEPVAQVTDPPPASGCDNSVGDVDCSFVDPQRFAGPMCEGFRGSCELLKGGHTFKPRAAAAIAECYARRGAAVCNMRVRTQCIRAGLEDSCPDPEFEPFCEQLVASCKKRRGRLDFNVEQCVKTLSGIGPKERDWAKGAMGSPSREGCKLMFPVY